VFFRVLLVDFGLFRPGIARALAKIYRDLGKYIIKVNRLGKDYINH
jgi:hypothetical protein